LQKENKMKAVKSEITLNKRDSSKEQGFTLLETVIAMVILTVSLLSVVTIFTSSVNFNSGNTVRTQALAILQQEVEVLRSAKFTPQITDATLSGGTKPLVNRTSANNTVFQIQVIVDDDPFTDLVQTDPTKTLKEITIIATPINARENWVSAVPTRVVLRRVRAN
jgi:prepilin-type N-terminal cleavage/methylation domain-containing protein